MNKNCSFSPRAKLYALTNTVDGASLDQKCADRGNSFFNELYSNSKNYKNTDNTSKFFLTFFDQEFLPEKLGLQVKGKFRDSF